MGRRPQLPARCRAANWIFRARRPSFVVPAIIDTAAPPQPTPPPLLKKSLQPPLAFNAVQASSPASQKHLGPFKSDSSGQKS